MDKIEDRSFGVIALRKTGPLLETLILFHKNGFWGFPKGHKENNETDKETASREFYEESGLKITSWIPVDPIEDRYIFTFNNKLISKSVVYFFAYASGHIKVQPEEIDSALWIPVNKLLDYFKFQNSIDFYDTLSKQLEKCKIEK